MVDAHDLFKKLGCGAKFDMKRFKEDAQRFKVIPSTNREEGDDNFEALDFFETKLKQSTKELKENKNKNSEELKVDTNEMPEEANMKRNKKKRKRKSGDDIYANSEIAIMSNRKKSKKVKHKTAVSQEALIQEHIEKMNLYRKENRIYVHGADIPDPMKTFEDLKKGVFRIILKNIKANGFTAPTAIQMQAIPILLQNRELLACAPTGSGKTLSYIIPLLYHLKEPKKEGFRAVVIAPTRELAQQIHREFVRINVGIGLRIHVLTKAKSLCHNFGSKSSKQFDILVATPNRLVYMLNQDPPFIELDKVEWLVLDEGDKLFEDGDTGFREQIATIYKSCTNPCVKHALFSATLANNVEEWCKLHLDSVIRINIGARNSAVGTVKQELMFVGQECGKLLAMRQILQRGFQPPVLVFVQSKTRAKELFNELIYDGLNVDVIHADRTQAQRENTVKCFRTGKIWILIATELIGRGIDFKGVNLVVNYDFPPTAVSYIHRIGRTGRAGREGKAITMFTEDDVINLRSIANVMKASGCDIPEWMLQIKKPDRKTQKKLSKAPIHRDHIKTVSRFDEEQSKKKKQIILMSKEKKKSLAL